MTYGDKQCTICGRSGHTASACKSDLANVIPKLPKPPKKPPEPDPEPPGEPDIDDIFWY